MIAAAVISSSGFREQDVTVAAHPESGIPLRLGWSGQPSTARSASIAHQSKADSPLAAVGDVSRSRLPRLYATIRNPVVYIVLIEAHVLSDFVERDSSLADESSYEAFSRAEAFGELRDAEHRTLDDAPLDGGFSDHRVLLRAVVPADVESMPLRI